jgi:hypothetical protein
MADDGNGGGGLYFIVGGLVVVVLGMVLYFGGYIGPAHTGSAVSSGASRSTTVERTVTPDSVSTSRTTTTTPAPAQ